MSKNTKYQDPNFSKKSYWENRNKDKPTRGQGVKFVDSVLVKIPKDIEMSFDNNGNIITKNRKYRRRKYRLPESLIYTRHTVNKEERKKLRKLGRK